MITVSIAGYIVGMAETIPEHYGGHDALVEEFDLERPASPGRNAFYLEVRRAFDWPFLYVAQQYAPNHWAGCYPGILLVPETHLLFVGSGERLLAYDLKAPARLWEDRVLAGFHHWQRHGDVILMSAELDLFALDLRGTKLWSAYVEPPWEYRVDAGLVYLDVMGTTSSFPLLSGLVTT